MLQPQPPGFNDHKFEFTFQINQSEKNVWKWLNDTKTFTDTQYWPYKVEFYSPDENTPTSFNEGVLTNHFGPFINFAGILTTVEENKYRDLQYNYGSYAFGMRWIRPYRLEFKSEANGDHTMLTGTLSTYVKPSWERMWNSSQKRFWKRFQKWASKSIK